MYLSFDQRAIVDIKDGRQWKADTAEVRVTVIIAVPCD